MALASSTRFAGFCSKRAFSTSLRGGAPVTDYNAFLTPLSLARKPSAIRSLQPLVSLPGMISLGGGMPNPALFPCTGITYTFADGTKWEMASKDVSEALQYSPTPGLPELVARLTRIQQHEHKPPGAISIAVTPGSQDGLAKIFDALLSKDSSVIVEAPTYSGTLAFLEPIGCHIATVPTDAGGLNPSALEALLDNWDKSEGTKGKRKPKVLYTIPTGSNPTGASLNLERKKQVYALAQKHDLIIIEDDPYYYLQYSKSRTPSFLSMDTDSRVIRTDSFSKILSAGIRVGFVTGPPALVDRVNLHNQASIMHNSGLSQSLVLALMRHWRAGEAPQPPAAAATSAFAQVAPAAASTTGLGPAFEAHLRAVQSFYASQCDAFFKAADRHLREKADGSGDLLADFSRPSAGMFVWMKLKPSTGITDTFELISKEAVNAKVLLVPGSAFYPGNPKTSFVRAAFSTATHQEMELAMERLGNLLRAKVAAAGK